jgi:hypothetical protein
MFAPAKPKTPTGASNFQSGNQETTMSLLDKTDVYQTWNERADRKHLEYGFVLVLAPMALTLVVASAIFSPAPVGSGISDEIWLVGCL